MVVPQFSLLEIFIAFLLFVFSFTYFVRIPDNSQRHWRDIERLIGNEVFFADCNFQLVFLKRRENFGSRASINGYCKDGVSCDQIEKFVTEKIRRNYPGASFEFLNNGIGEAELKVLFHNREFGKLQFRILRIHDVYPEEWANFIEITATPKAPGGPL